MLATCLHLMKCTPYIYQGEELGMTNFPFSSVEECDDLEAHDAHGMQLCKAKRGCPSSLRMLRDNRVIEHISDVKLT